jgi:hypothetical protein
VTDSRFPQILEAIEWNIVTKQSVFPTFTESGFPRPLPKQFINITNSRMVAVGVGSIQSKPTWKHAGIASQSYPFTFTYVSDFKTFPALLQSHRLRLNNMNVLIFDTKLDEWTLTLDFPYWFKDVTYEVHRYDGLEIDLHKQMELINSQLKLE